MDNNRGVQVLGHFEFIGSSDDNRSPLQFTETESFNKGELGDITYKDNQLYLLTNVNGYNIWSPFNNQTPLHSIDVNQTQGSIINILHNLNSLNLVVYLINSSDNTYFKSFISTSIDEDNIGITFNSNFNGKIFIISKYGLKVDNLVTNNIYIPDLLQIDKNSNIFKIKNEDVLLKSNITKADVGLSLADNTADVNKNVLSATKLTSERTINFTGNVTGTFSFDGTSNVNSELTLNSNGVTAGTYGNSTKIPVIQVDSTGRISSITTQDLAVNNTLSTVELDNLIISSINLVTTELSTYTLDTTPNSQSSVKYTISIRNGTDIQLSEMLLINDGNQSYMTEYGVIRSNNTLAVFDSIVDVNNMYLTVLPLNLNTTFKVQKTVFK